MNPVVLTVSVIFSLAIALYANAGDEIKKEHMMTALGTFEVKLEPQEDKDAPVGRMLINKQYSGDIEGVGIGQMISKRTDSGVAVYSAIEEFQGSVKGKTGAFTLIHKGYMSSETQSLEVRILQNSGSGELKSISGSLDIIQQDGIHKYALNYEL